MTELLPCPWCGSDIRLSPINVPWSDNEPCWAIWHIDGTKAYEAKCPMEMGGYDTEAEAIAAWNSRAERTCHKVIPDEMEGYVFCSECGAEIGEYGYPNYCHNCGAKVVK